MEQGDTGQVSRTGLTSWLGAEPSHSQPSDAHYASLEKGPLVSFYNDEEFKTIPKLKEHLQAEWTKRAAAAKKAQQKREAQEALKKDEKVKKRKQDD